jgi:mono/diheme cytochrome c family protein
MCLSCLARREGVAEHDVRSAALVLIVRQGLRLVQRTCSDCHHPGEALVVQQSA